MTEFKLLTPEEQVARVLKADAWRVRLLSAVTVFLSMMTVAAAGLAAAAFYEQYQRATRQVERYHMKLGENRILDPVVLSNLNREFLDISLRQSVRMSEHAGLLCLAAGLVGLCAVGTMFLIAATNQATIGQIQASLAAIAGQLAEVQRGRGTMPPTAGG